MRPSITVDVGTTSVKLCSFDAAGTLRASARVTTPTVRDAHGEIYDLEVLRGAIVGFIRGLRDADRAAVERIALTGVGESGGLVHADGTLASPMILWHDHRGAPYLERLSDADRARVYAVTGLPANANYGLSKVAWAVAAAGPGAAGAQWLNVAEYLAATMTGRRWSEYSLASRTMALDVRSRTWSPEMCALVGIDPDVFPELRPARDGSAVTAGFASEAGLRPDVVVHVAGHDHMVGAVGAGLRRGDLLNSTGTTEGLLFLRDAPVTDAATAASKLANGIACTGDDVTLFASIPTGGSAFATLQGMLAMDAVELSALVSRLHDRYVAGAVDLDAMPLVLPQFRGSPPPAKRATARAAIARLGTDATADDLVFGTFLGMVLQFRDVLELFPERPQHVRVIGPAGKNPLWLRLKADLLGAPLSVATFPEVVSRGAQALASGAEYAWDDSRPDEVPADADRSARVQRWADQAREQWEYLKGMPA